MSIVAYGVLIALGVVGVVEAITYRVIKSKHPEMQPRSQAE